MRIWSALLLLGFVCTCGQERMGSRAIGVLSSGVINDPSNKSLRFDLLKFGLDQFCREMQRRGLALKMRDGEPNIGRFAATSCQSQLLDEPKRQTIVFRYAGRGFGWTNVTQRVGFESQGLVEYAPDFQMHGEAMYIYFRPRNVDATRFQTLLVESAVANAGINLAGVRPDEVGKAIVDAQLKRGFTVIRYSERGETDMGIGIVPLGQRPFRPFQVQATSRVTLDNDRTEVHAGQQDYIGGLNVEDDDQALYITATVEGAPAVDLLVVPGPVGQGLFAKYTSTAGPAVPAAAPFAALVQTGTTTRQYIPVPRGSYMLVLDHSSAVGTASPPMVALDDRAARVDYLIQVGERP